MSIFAITEELEVEECCECHMTFAMTTQFMKAKRKDHKMWYCPAGHPQYYAQKSKETKLKEQLASTQEEVNRERYRRQDAEVQRNVARKQRNALKGHLGRAKRRAAAGTCPCCKRTFQALTTHMLKHHPEYVKKNRVKK